MPPRSPEAFRFAPPRLTATPELGWVLVRAFAAETVGVALPDPAIALELARALGLAARIAARTSDERLRTELGPGAAAPWRQVRARAVALELRLEAALAAAAAVCARSNVPFALLKGRALVLAGLAAEGGRPASDVDLLVPEDRLRELQRALEAAGFQNPGNRAYEHQAPLLRHSGGGAIELHRTLPGVRLDGRHSATFAALEREGLLAAVEVRRSAIGGDFALPGAQKSRCPPAPPALGDDARLPAREVLIAHALVHTLAQHAFTAAHPGFQLLADLTDLGCASAVATEARVLRWIERDVSARELRAALDLVDALAAGDLDFLADRECDAARLAGHFVACAGDAEYAESLKLRLFESPLSDHRPASARLRLLARTLAPPAGAGLRAWLERPRDLLRRWRSARRAARPRG